MGYPGVQVLQVLFRTVWSLQVFALTILNIIEASHVVHSLAMHGCWIPRRKDMQGWHMMASTGIQINHVFATPSRPLMVKTNQAYNLHITIM